MILRSFVEAYAVLADLLVLRGSAAAGPDAALLAGCMTLGNQYLLEGRLRSPESVSRHLFQTGAELARHRQLLTERPNVLSDRVALAAKCWTLVERMNAVHEIAVRRVTALVAAEQPAA